MNTQLIPWANSRNLRSAVNTLRGSNHPQSSKPAALRSLLHSWNIGARSWGNNANTAFLIMLKTGHALPLAGARLLRPRMSRDEHAEHPRKVIGGWPQTREVHDCDSVARKTQTQIDHVRELSVSALSPRKQTIPRTGRVLGNAAASIVRATAATKYSHCPQTVCSRELSTFANPQSVRTFRKHGLARSHPRRGIVAAILPPTHFLVGIQINPFYVLV